MDLNTHSRPRYQEADGIIIHSMGQYVGEQHAPDFLESIGLSAHFYIEPDGLILFGVDHSKIAYHAGKSKFKEQTDLNSTFIGLEILIEGKHSWNSFKEAIKTSDSFTNKHYQSVADVCRDLINIYPKITLDRIVEHSEVSGSDVRQDPKIDPGKGFSMKKLKELI